MSAHDTKPPAQETSMPELAQSLAVEGWKEAAIAWEVCRSLHREYAKGKDPLFKTRQADFVKHAEAARAKALGPFIEEDGE